MATGKKMSEYTQFSELTSEEKTTYLGNAAVTTFGVKDNVEGNINVNIPLSTLVPSVPVSDVTVNGSSVVNNGVAAVTVPTATGLAGDGLSVNGSTGKLDVSNKVPAPTATTDRGKVLTVNNSDEVVWDTPASSTYVKEDKGLTASGGYIGVDCAGTGGLITDANGLYIKHDENDKGKFLTVGDDNEITWGTPSGGGGGGGNPYTKASVTPGDCYLNGKTSSYDMPLYDQDVTISNNTYSVLPSPIGYYPTVEEPEYRYQHNLDNLVIKLPSNTEFPMAVVEFTVQDNDDYSYWGCVNNVKVKVGETELTRMYSAPYNPNTLLMGGEYNNQFQYWTLVTVPNGGGNPYYRIEGVFNANRGAEMSAFAHGTKVQVQIFGSCFNVTISQACGEPAAS